MSERVIGDPKQSYYGSARIYFPLDAETVEQLAIVAANAYWGTNNWDMLFGSERTQWPEVIRAVMTELVKTEPTHHPRHRIGARGNDES